MKNIERLKKTAFWQKLFMKNIWIRGKIASAFCVPQKRIK